MSGENLNGFSQYFLSKNWGCTCSLCTPPSDGPAIYGYCYDMLKIHTLFLSLHALMALNVPFIKKYLSLKKKLLFISIKDIPNSMKPKIFFVLSVTNPSPIFLVLQALWVLIIIIISHFSAPIVKKKIWQNFKIEWTHQKGTFRREVWWWKIYLCDKCDQKLNS